MPQERLAFDTRAYKDATPEAVAADLAAVVVENSRNSPIFDRIHSGRLIVSNDGRIIDQRTGLAPRYSRSSEFDRREAASGDNFDHVLLTHPEGTMVLWLSPPEGELRYGEGRIRVGVRGHAFGRPLLVYYGIPVKNELTYQDFGQVATNLAEFTESNKDLGGIEKLREQVFIIPPQESDPWDFLSEQIPSLDEAWKAIKAGKVDENFLKVYGDASKIAPAVYKRIQTAQAEDDYVQAGAQGEKFMMSLGYTFSGSGCGRLNFEKVSSYFRIHAEISEGKIRIINGEAYYWVEKCGQCPHMIKDWIPAKYRCPGCDGEFLGCG